MKTLYPIILGLVLFVSSFGFAQSNHSHDSHHDSDPPSVHGMLMFGSSSIYLSHLPMFHSPHDYQIILKAELNPVAKAKYLKAKLDNPEESVFTLVPEPFVLPEMIKEPKPFKATVFKGHFERGGTSIATEITVNITEVIYFKKLNPQVQKPDVAKYIYLGDEKEIFGIHLIGGKPDFDQVVEVEVSNQLIGFLNQASYIEVEMPDQPAQSPLNAGTSPLSYVVTEQGSLPLDTQKIKGEIYLEFGDLSF